MKTSDLERRRQRLEQLRALSQKVQPLVKEGTFESVNEALIECFYKADGHNEFHSFNEWKRRGAKIKKGSEAFCVWGRPQPRTVINDKGEDKEDEFFPMAYIFSNMQVTTEEPKP